MDKDCTYPAAPTLAIQGEGDRLALDGVLDIHTLTQATDALSRWAKKERAGHDGRALDLKRLSGLDTPGALLLRRLGEQGVELTNARAEHKALLGLIGELELTPLRHPAAVRRWRQLVIQLGKGADEAWHDARDVVAFVGRAANALGRALITPHGLRLPSISRQVAETGVDALPVIGLMAIMISVVIGYQGVAQLRPYGGEDFTINLVAVSMFREMGVLITAIMVAGRSGSAFTAEIGVMKAREEVDALKVMGMDAMNVLVVPRLIGLVITLPLLTFYSDVMGLVGGWVISQSLLHVSPLQYVDRVHHALAGSDLLVGLIKAPIFGFLIAVIGCMHGLRVTGSAASVGRETTRAVVAAIFVVIVLDALFSILFEKLGL
ncbi:MAG TPA: ABC transporter permease [Casimicrobiaceae bacterium]|nr:ABC transporter permease [Casimicrobiaceae bacterium]